MDSGYEIRDTRCGRVDTGYEMWEGGYGMADGMVESGIMRQFSTMPGECRVNFRE
jgi:hypothetical protein